MLVTPVGPQSEGCEFLANLSPQTIFYLDQATEVTKRTHAYSGTQIQNAPSF